VGEHDISIPTKEGPEAKIDRAAFSDRSPKTIAASARGTDGGRFEHRTRA
jgi:hypothetical protein